MILYAIPLLVSLALVPSSANLDTSNFWGSRLNLNSRNSKHTGVSTVSSSGEGWVEMDAKIDMRGILSLLQDIPAIKNALNNVTDKVNTFDKELILSTVIPQFAGLKSGIGSEVKKVEEAIRGLFEELEHGKLDSIEKKVLKVLELLESLGKKPAQCNLTKVEDLIDEVGKKLENLVLDILEHEKIDMALNDKELAGIKNNGDLLGRVLSILVGMTKNPDHGFGGLNDCKVCQILKQVYTKEVDNTNTLAHLAESLKAIPKEVGVIIESDTDLGSIGKDIKSLLNLDNSIKAGVDKLIKLVENLSSMSKNYFTTAHKITIETHQTIVDAMATVQKSARRTEKALGRFVAARAGRTVDDSD